MGMQEDLDLLRNSLSQSDTAAKTLAEIGLKNLATLIRKNHDYGSSGLKPPILCPDVDARESLQVRMSDKISRIQALQSKNAQVNESLDDTFGDLANYCLLWLAVPLMDQIADQK